MEGKLRNMASIYLTNKNRILLLYRIGSRVIEDSYTGTAGGHFERDELNDARACVLRELYEETGLLEQDIGFPKLRYITLRLKNGEVRQNYYFFAELKDAERETASNEGNLQWFEFDEVMELPMPFTAKYVVRHYLETGRNTNMLYGGISEENGVCFTVMEDF